MKSGQQPKPAALKLLNGNPGKKPIQEEVKPPAGEVKRPKFVKGKAGRLWNQYAPSLEEKGVLTIWDADMFGAWCCLMAEFQKAPDQFITSKMTQMRLLAEAFCLIPPGRSRYSPKNEKKDEDARYFGT
jgi:phage terminase small subunit